MRGTINLEGNKLLDELKLMVDPLKEFPITSVFRSIGYNIFMDFGPIDASTEATERCLWIGNATWRLTKNDVFIIGSSNNTERIDANILQLMGTKLLSVEVLNQFMDIKVTFDNGLQLTTFFCWPVENQWVIFRPESVLSIDFSSQEQRLSIPQSLKGVIFSSENWKKPSRFSNLVIRKIINLDNGILKIHFENNKRLILNRSCWRLEKNHFYVASTTIDDESDLEKELNPLLGKKVLSSFVSEDSFDVKLSIEDNYVLKTFKCG